MKKTKIKHLVNLLVSLFIASNLLLGFSSSALAGKKIVLKAGDVHPMDYPTVQGLVRIGDLLKE